MLKETMMHKENGKYAFWFSKEKFQVRLWEDQLNIPNLGEHLHHYNIAVTLTDEQIELKKLKGQVIVECRRESPTT